MPILFERILRSYLFLQSTFTCEWSWLQRLLKSQFSFYFFSLTNPNNINFHVRSILYTRFCVLEVKYLGYVVNAEGLHVDPDKIKPITEYPAPTNLRQLRRFLEMMGWYSRFIPKFTDYHAPLNKLPRKGIKWQWEKEQEDAFHKLKLALTQAPVLARPYFSRPFCLQTDASDIAIAAVLRQEFEGEEHPIYYVCRMLTRTERNYTDTEREFLAVLWAVKRLGGYLLGNQFTVITDHYSLLWLNNLKNPSGRLARWHTALSAYNIKFDHRKDSEHKVLDDLSRAFEGLTDAAALAPTSVDAWYQKRLESLRRTPKKFLRWRNQNGLLYYYRPNPLIDLVMPDLDAWKFCTRS